jgi:hypothetical protein
MPVREAARGEMVLMGPLEFKASAASKVFRARLDRAENRVCLAL